MQMHNGTLTVESEPEVKTVFTLRFWFFRSNNYSSVEQVGTSPSRENKRHSNLLVWASV